MLLIIAIQMLMGIVGMAMQVVFYAAAAYWVAKMGRKGWKAGE